MNHLQEKLNVHVPVMSTETIKYLNPKSDGIYIIEDASPETG